MSCSCSWRGNWQKRDQQLPALRSKKSKVLISHIYSEPNKTYKQYNNTIIPTILHNTRLCISLIGSINQSFLRYKVLALVLHSSLWAGLLERSSLTVSLFLTQMFKWMHWSGYYSTLYLYLCSSPVFPNPGLGDSQTVHTLQEWRKDHRIHALNTGHGLPMTPHMQWH